MQHGWNSPWTLSRNKGTAGSSACLSLPWDNLVRVLLIPTTLVRRDHWVLFDDKFRKNDHEDSSKFTFNIKVSTIIMNSHKHSIWLSWLSSNIKRRCFLAWLSQTMRSNRHWYFLPWLCDPTSMRFKRNYKFIAQTYYERLLFT